MKCKTEALEPLSFGETLKTQVNKYFYEACCACLQTELRFLEKGLIYTLEHFVYSYYSATPPFHRH